MMLSFVDDAIAGDTSSNSPSLRSTVINLVLSDIACGALVENVGIVVLFEEMGSQQENPACANANECEGQPSYACVCVFLRYTASWALEICNEVYMYTIFHNVWPTRTLKNAFW